MVEHTRPDVLYAYGAGSGRGDHNLWDLAWGLDVAREAIGILDWGALPGVTPPADLLDWLKDRWNIADRQSREVQPLARAIAAGDRVAVDELMAADAVSVGDLPLDAALLGPGLAWNALPPGLRRHVIRVIAGQVRDIGVLPDSLYFVAHSDELAPGLWQQVRDWIGRTKGPRVLVGLSLGGMFMVETLAWALQHPTESGFHAEDIALLVTAGSQAPVLQKCGALNVLHRADEDDRPFSPWLNVWNPDDLLSFPTEDVFDAPTIWDRPIVDEARAFPENHGAYFRNRMLYAAVDQRLEQLGHGSGLFAVEWGREWPDWTGTAAGTLAEPLPRADGMAAID
jgi:hypothetical protein